MRDPARNRAAARCRGSGQPGLVSVILPVYNGERYLAAAIEGMQAQTWRKFELIVVDDGSSDRSGEIAAGYRRTDGRITVVRQENQHVAAALNRGFAIATGEFHTWVSADNVSHPEFLSTLVAALEDRPGIALVYADYEEWSDPGERPAMGGPPLGTTRVRLCSDPTALKMQEKNVIGAAFLYRSLVTQLLGPYLPARRLLEDHDFWLRVLRYLTIEHVSTARGLLLYRRHDGSLTAQASVRRMARQHQVMMAAECVQDLIRPKAEWLLFQEPGIWSAHSRPGLAAAIAPPSGDAEAARPPAARLRLRLGASSRAGPTEGMWELNAAPALRSDTVKERVHRLSVVPVHAAAREGEVRLIFCGDLRDGLAALEVAASGWLWRERMDSLNAALAKHGIVRRALYWSRRALNLFAAHDKKDDPLGDRNPP